MNTPTKIYYNREALQKVGVPFPTESLFAAPFEDPRLFQFDGPDGSSLASVVASGTKLLELVPIERAHCVVLPFKWRMKRDRFTRALANRGPLLRRIGPRAVPDDLTRELIDESVRAGKRMVALFNDDFDGRLAIESKEGVVFRSSLHRSTKGENEFALPPFFDDAFDGQYLDAASRLSISFCGQHGFKIRKRALDAAGRSEIVTPDFILRSGFWAPEIPNRAIARAEYVENLRRNLFGLAVRGGGNFSYRFYEILSAGRIPVVVDTDQVFPFEDLIDYSRHCVVVKYSELDKLDGHIRRFLDSHTQQSLLELQQLNRKLWVEYLSPEGFLRHFARVVEVTTT